MREEFYDELTQDLEEKMMLAENNLEVITQSEESGKVLVE